MHERIRTSVCTSNMGLCSECIAQKVKRGCAPNAATCRSWRNLDCDRKIGIGRLAFGLCCLWRCFRLLWQQLGLDVYQKAVLVTSGFLGVVFSGQSQPPCHLSMFLEVTDPRNTCADWSCFVSHRLSVVNQRTDERSVTKESQNRYSKAAKDWGWREFVTLTSLFDQDSGFLVQDMVVFSAEVLILKETSTMQELSEYEGEAAASGGGSDTGRIVNRGTFTWRVENFLAFKEIMETRKIFSKFFQAGGCELRIGKAMTAVKRSV